MAKFPSRTSSLEKSSAHKRNSTCFINLKKNPKIHKIPYYRETKIFTYIVKGDLLKAALIRHWEQSKGQRRRLLLASGLQDK
jgi:hypothetical protein